VSRFALEPIRRLARANGLVDDSSLARCLGLPRRTLGRADEIGLNDSQADRCATALGRHPVEVWGDAWWSMADGAGDRREHGSGSIAEKAPGSWLIRWYVDDDSGGRRRRARVVHGDRDAAVRALRSAIAQAARG
jgi:hypothetical protein